jgi:hypothetical protein
MVVVDTRGASGGRPELALIIEDGTKGGWLARTWAIAAVLAGSALSLAINWPGHLSYDSVVQLAEGRAGSYSGAHPPVMSWLLGLGDAVWPGAALFVVVQTALIAGALVALLTLGRRVGWPCVALCVMVAVTPQLLIYRSIVWKDVLFAGSTVAGFAAMARAAACWPDAARRWAWTAVCGLLLVLATLTRQNGAVVLPFASLAIGLIAGRSKARGGFRRGLAYGAAFLLATAGIAMGAAAALNARIDPDAEVGSPWRALHAYDLVNALSLQPRMALPVMHAQAPALERVLRTQGVRAYSPVRADGLEAILERARVHGPVEPPLDAQWRDMIVHQPLLYLRARARTFSWVFLTPDHDQCLLVYTGVDGPADAMADAGLTRRKSAWDDTLADSAMLLAPTPVYSHAAYAGLAVLLLGLLLWRRRAPDFAIAGLLGAALSFVASFAVISIACDYRYLYAIDVAAIAAAIYVTATWRGTVQTLDQDRDGMSQDPAAGVT